MFCQQCGKRLDDGAQFCSGCGSGVGGASGTVGTAPQSTYNTYGATNPHDRRGFGWAFLGFIFSGSMLLVLILYFIMKPSYPLRAQSILKGFFIGLVFWAIIIVLYIFVIIPMVMDGLDNFN